MADRDRSLRKRSRKFWHPGLRCFIDSHPVDSAADLEFDHILPIATVDCQRSIISQRSARSQTREKSTMTLGQYRDRLALKKFFQGSKKRRLDDLLDMRLGATKWGRPLTNEVDNNSIAIFPDSGKQTLPLFTCAATGSATSSLAFQPCWFGTTQNSNLDHLRSTGCGSCTATSRLTRNSLLRCVDSSERTSCSSTASIRQRPRSWRGDSPRLQARYRSSGASPQGDEPLGA